MSNHKFDVGDVVRLNSPAFGKMNGETCVVVRIETDPYKHLIVRADDGKEIAAQEFCVDGVPLEEVQRYYADKPRRGFIVDGLTVDELESGQDEAYQTFQRAVKNATAGEWLECAEIRAEHKRLKRKVIMDLIGTVAASVGLIGGLIRIAMDGLGLTEVLPALFCAVCVSVYAVSYEAGVIKGVCDEMKRIDSKILGQSGDE